MALRSLDWWWTFSTIAVHVEKLCPQAYRFKTILKLLILDQFANKVYEWVGRSSNRRRELISSMTEYDLQPLVVLQFH